VSQKQDFFSGETARTYDGDGVSGLFSPEILDPTVDCLADLAQGGSVLEFGIGTGRVAIPLAARGIQAAGIDFSADMLGQLRTKPGAAAISVVEGDMATTRVAGEFSLVYLVANTILNLTTQDEQVACFENAARHLRARGRFVIECWIPTLRQLPSGARGVPFVLSEDYIGIDEFTDLTHGQQFRSRHLRRGVNGAFHEGWAPFRFVWPSELDLMARIAGMKLEYRWAGWDRSPFTGESTSAVSVWRLRGD
jgi:SAM-dependent methyltransferase